MTFRRTIYRNLPLRLVTSLLMLGGLGAARLTAQTAETLSGVKRVALDWTETEKSSTEVRDRVLHKLRASRSVEIVSPGERADAVLHGKAAIWVTGHALLSPRSKSVRQATYGGFASMEVSGKDGGVLWSYLVTPRTVRWRTITDDLADQLVHQFLEALADKRTRENPASVSAPGAKSGDVSSVALRGAGSTFAAPMYQKWFESFAQMRPGIQIEYAAVGSEEGVRRFLSGQADFGATDMPLSEQQLNVRGGQVLQIATMVGAVVPIYNLKGTANELNLTPEVLAGIFMGRIARWNAPEIRAINKYARLPDEAIAVIHRSDGSGTTFAWTEYLSKVSAEWRSNLGMGTTVRWPVGDGAVGNEGVATAVRKRANSIGYVEFLYALHHELDFAAVRNASGEYVKADLDSVTHAAKTVEVPRNDQFGRSITNAVGKRVYPIATLTWLLVPLEGHDQAKTAALRDLLRWMLTDGQRQCEGLGYARLPAEFANRELQSLEALDSAVH